MTRDDAITLTQWLTNAWPRPEWTPAQIEAFVGALLPYDAEVATQALATAHRSIDFRPSFAEFFAFYRSAKADAASRQHPPPQESGKKNTLPPWVKEWVCARFLYARFGRDQDMRRFTQQQDWADPDTSLMPPGEWAKEAAAITNRDALRAVQGAS